MCICLYRPYTLITVVGYYDLRVLSMSVMGFQKKSLDDGWVGGVSSIQFFFDFLIFLTLQIRQDTVSLQCPSRHEMNSMYTGFTKEVSYLPRLSSTRAPIWIIWS